MKEGRSMPNIEFLTEKRFTIATHLINVAVENNLSLVEFLLLMYFEDALDKTFNVDKISKILALNEKDVLLAFNHLLSLNFIELEACKDETNKCCDIISLDPLYKNIYEKKEKKAVEAKKESIFDLFQKELGRSISPMEYEIINAWLLKGFSEELVLGALKEAVYNGVSSLRYIDKILFEWQKKGYHTMTEVETGLNNHREDTKKAPKLFDYNWLEDEG